MSKGFRKNLLENAKKVKTISKSPGSELTAGEQYILERKQRAADDGLTLGERLLQERLEIRETPQLPVTEESVISEDVKETAEMISEVSEAILEVAKEEVEPLTEESRILGYIDTIKNNESKKSIVEQDLQNSAATMADLASLRALVRNLQTSLTSLGGGGLGEQDVISLIESHESSPGGGGGHDYLKSVVEDTTPQLGGELDANGFDIVNLDFLRLNADGEGLRMTQVGALDNAGNGTNGNFRVFATHDLILGAGGNATAVRIDKTTKKATFTGTIRVHDAYTLPEADGSANQYLQTDGAGNISFADGPAVGATVAGGRFQFNNNFTDNSTYVKSKFGVSNITRNSSGNYTVQFDSSVSTALVDENSYIATVTVDYAGDTPTSATFVAAVNGQTSNSFNILIEGLEGHDADHNGNSYINCTVVRAY